MIDGGLRAVLTCVDPEHLAPELCGREFNAALLDATRDRGPVRRKWRVPQLRLRRANVPRTDRD